jgi:hypothetical protein
MPACAVDRRTIGVGLDQVADHLPGGRLGDAEVAIQKELAQAFACVAGIAWFDV